MSEYEAPFSRIIRDNWFTSKFLPGGGNGRVDGRSRSKVPVGMPNADSIKRFDGLFGVL